MKKRVVYLASLIIILIIAGLSIILNSAPNNMFNEKNQYQKYSFTGDSQQLTLNGGLIVIDGGNSSIYYDDVIFKSNIIPEIVFMNEKIIANNGITLISSSIENNVESMKLDNLLNQGHSKSIGGDLLIESTDLNNLSYILTYTDNRGNETELSLELKVTNIEPNHN